MQGKTSDATLVALTGDTDLIARLRACSADGRFDLAAAADPEAARAALTAHGARAIVLHDLRGPRASLRSAIPVLGRQGVVLALVDDEASPAAAAALEAGAVAALAAADLSPALLRHLIRLALLVRAGEERQKKTRLNEPVIGIPAQALFWEILSLAVRRARRNKDFFALLLLDFDNLPDGESAEGPYRDVALRDLVARIQPTLRGSDTIARLESQQLVILVESMPRVEDVQIVAEKIIEEVEAPGDSALDLAIGIALFPTSADSAEDMLARATDAMLQARERGRNRFAFG
ncbi:diguanylate cyclase (GGDEF)-like protein [Dongia mobilis]|uniref:Diguanylate cyclase (GGDEF)-like protein n=1 Tax=Dongia mobilis TaxID=578943 RepID=A0A4R6WVJ4_9PROT|nr:GGDEF domain-containing protein [Dongia mobilis]TDQ84200.1 diguanylate cyclase (GGDEF)-like protein [Dongia mobilis]